MSENQTNATENTIVETEVVLTREQKLDLKIEKARAAISKYTAEFNALIAEREGIEKLAGVTAGSRVTARIGRGESAKEVLCTVIAEQVEEDGSRRFKVFFGEGMSADVTVIGESNIVAVH